MCFSYFMKQYWLHSDLEERRVPICSARHQNSGNMFSLVSCGSPCGLLSSFSISPLLLLMMARSLSCWSRLAYLYHGRYSKNAATGEQSCAVFTTIQCILVLLTHLANSSLPHSNTTTSIYCLQSEYHLAKPVLVTLCHVNIGSK